MTAARVRPASRAWWLVFSLALAIAGYALSFTLRGLDAFGLPLLESFYRRPWAVWLHIVFGAIALTAGALNFRHAIRRRQPWLHRRIGEAYVLSALGTALAGGWLAVFAYGGVGNRLGFGLLALVTLLCTVIAWRYALLRDFVQHRRWMIRSYALIFAGVTLRLQAPFLIAWQGDFAGGYAIVAWSCWIPNLIVAELILRRTGHVE